MSDTGKRSYKKLKEAAMENKMEEYYIIKPIYALKKKELIL